MVAPPSSSQGPLVSVVVAVKDGASSLQRSLDSIFSQRDARFEVLVIDGGSKDGTVDILHQETARIAFWCSEPDTGIYSAWNKALRKARGDWICFLGADDRFHDERAMADMVSAASAVPPDVQVVYGQMNLVSRKGNCAETVGKPWSRCRADFLGGFMIPHPGTLHRRALFERHGEFDTSYLIAGDYEMLLRELVNGEAHFVDRIVVDMQLGGRSARPEGIWRALREVVRAREKHGLNIKPSRLRWALITSRIGGWIHSGVGDGVFNWLADAYRLVRGKPPLWRM